MISTKNDSNYWILKGITLLELLVTMAIFSSIFSLLMNSFLQGQEHNNHLRVKLELRQEMRILQQEIAKDLQAAVYLKNFMKSIDQNYDKKSGIFGENYQYNEQDIDNIYMHVHRPVMCHVGVSIENDPELHEIAWFLEEIQPGEEEREKKERLYKLIRREEFYIDGNLRDGDENCFLTFSQNLINFNIRYLAANSTNNWQDEWESQGNSNQLPQSVEITIELLHSSGERLEEIRQINIRPPMGKNINWSF